MARYYLDSSAVFKRYVAESGTSWVRGITDPRAGHQLLMVRITGTEVVSGLVRQHPPLATPVLDQALADFKSDLRNQYQIVEVTEGIVERAMSMAEKQRLRGYDAVQLAAAVESNDIYLSLSLPPITFVTADAMLIAAGASEGLPVEDPNQHP